VATANYIRNRCITNVLRSKTPFEIWHGKRPDVKHLRIFGETAYMLDKTPGKGKLDPRGIHCIFLGYDETSKGFRVWVPSKQKVTITRDIKFFNTTQPMEEPINSIYTESVDCDQEITTESQEMSIFPEASVNPEESENESERSVSTERRERESHIVGDTINRGPGRPRKLLTGKRSRPRRLFQPQQAKSHHIESIEKIDVVQDSDNQTSNDIEVNNDAEANLISFSSEIPCQQALSGPDQEEWKEAITKEIECLINKDTWEIVERPNKRPVIGCRMVLRNKCNAEGQIEKRKARLVARGFAQRPGIDYHDTFAPVARLGSLRLLSQLSTI